MLTNLPPTLLLAGLGFLAASVLAAVLAFASSLVPARRLRAALQALPALFVSMPVFWLGIMLIQIIS